MAQHFFNQELIEKYKKRIFPFLISPVEGLEFVRNVCIKNLNDQEELINLLTAIHRLRQSIRILRGKDHKNNAIILKTYYDEVFHHLTIHK